MRFASLLIAALMMWPAAAGGSENSEPEFTSYVALGDSYTAGPLVPALTTGPLGCARSSANYPAYLASYFDIDEFTDVSCSAARSKHMFETQTGILPGPAPENSNPPQLSALSADTDLVTLGIGGNDFGLFGQMIDQCAQAAEERPNAETPCKDRFTEDGVDTKMRDAQKIRGHIEEVLAGIHERAPRATVVVVNYLHILPERGTCADVPFAPGDYGWGTKVHRQLNESMRRAAARYDAEYVDMYAASKGHDACSSEPWVNGAAIKSGAMSYHPFRSGMRAIAHTIYEQLTATEAPAAMPDLALLKRLPDVVDVPALIEYLVHAGNVPGETLDRPAPDGSAQDGPAGDDDSYDDGAVDEVRKRLGELAR